MRAVRVFVIFFIIYLAKSFKYRLKTLMLLLKTFYLFCNNNEFFIFFNKFLLQLFYFF